MDTAVTLLIWFACVMMTLIIGIVAWHLVDWEAIAKAKKEKAKKSKKKAPTPYKREPLDHKMLAKKASKQ